MRIAAVCVLLGAIVLGACGPGAGPAPGAVRATEAEAGKLQAADAADGTNDHVVAKCAVCGLVMDGTSEHVSRYAGYELHFCSAECKETFDHDPHAVLVRLPAPAQ
jgi:YHS domain-containing protein